MRGLVANFHAFKELFLHVGHAGGGEQGGEHIFVGKNVVQYGAGLMTPGQRMTQGTR